ncbi:HupE/UreJ family protein [Agrobacterium vitis]|uniref:HupE/UreJ family protein n=1 Tax=Allorhizobium ampelinum TaxID=3025782 RepID=UPI001F2AC7CC|nr:HupE/UreJ family protein [Allorhizobium ampelinum]MCF1464258.1 HupE/UreJ family protein [Allorhizobium ampelinum]
MTPFHPRKIPGHFQEHFLRRFRAINGLPLRLMITLLGFAGSAAPAFAHVLGGPMGGFGSGFEHPLLGADHFLAMLAVGLWGAQMGGRSVWTLPATFPLIMCIGGVIGMLADIPDPVISGGIALSLLALGAAIAANWKAPEFASLAIIALFALFHGYPHGKMAPNATDPAAYTVGFVVATGMIHILGIAIGYGLGRLYNGMVVRALGGLIVVAGVYYLVTGQM